MKICSLGLPLIISMLLLVSCGTDTATESTRRGYSYNHHVSTGGQTPQPGEYAYFHIVMRYQDSVLNTSHGMSDLPRIRIPGEEEITDQTPIIVDALEFMAVGDSLTLLYPLDSVESVPPEFAHMDIIEYDLTLVEIKSEEEFQAEMEAVMAERQAAAQAAQARMGEVEELAKLNLDKLEDGSLNLQTSPSGLQYIIHEEGTGEQPQNGDMVSVQYYGTYLDGEMFDTSFDTGEAYGFALGQRSVIAGWDEGIGYLKEGAKASLIVPPALAYGETGYMDIPGNTTLYFYVELERVN